MSAASEAVVPEMHPECLEGRHRLFKVGGVFECERRGCPEVRPAERVPAVTVCRCGVLTRDITTLLAHWQEAHGGVPQARPADDEEAE